MRYIIFIASLCMYKFFQFIQSPAGSYRLLQEFSCLRVVLCFSGCQKHLTAKCKAQLCKVFRTFSLQRINGFLYLQDISYCVSQGLIHIRNQGIGFPAGTVTDSNHFFCQCKGILFLLHKCTTAGFYIQHDSIRTGSQLLTHDGTGNQ